MQTAKIKTHNTYAKDLHILALSFLVVAGLIVGTSVALAADITPGAVLRLTNEARKKEGLPELRQNEALSRAALAKAKDMFKNDYFAHTSPEGVTPWHWIKQSGYSYTLAGENLAINYDSASAQQKAWMKSPTHRANIMNGSYQEMGVAVVEGKIDGKKALVTVQVFAKPKTVAVIKDQERVVEEPLASEVKGVEVVPAVETALPVQVELVPAQSASTLLVPTPVPLGQESLVPGIDRYTQAIGVTIFFLETLMLSLAMIFLVRASKALFSMTSFRNDVTPNQAAEAVFAFQAHYPRTA